jgi:FkbM family methyltransferase
LNGYARVVQVEQRALYGRSGEVLPFFVSLEPTNSGTSSLIDHGRFVTPDRSIEVKTAALDDVIRDAGVDRLRLVKIDVERAEEFVLAGAARLLEERRIDYLIVEMLGRAGYEGYLALPAERRLMPLAEVAPERFGDFLFVRPGLTLP